MRIFPGLATARAPDTVRFDHDGNVWASGWPLTRLDRKTKKITLVFRHDIRSTYDVKEDSDGNIWFTRPDTNQIGMVNWKTLKVSLWTPPTPGCFPRRMEIDSDGIVWFGEYNAGKLGRFAPRQIRSRNIHCRVPAIRMGRHRRGPSDLVFVL